MYVVQSCNLVILLAAAFASEVSAFEATANINLAVYWVSLEACNDGAASEMVSMVGSRLRPAAIVTLLRGLEHRHYTNQLSERFPRPRREWVSRHQLRESMWGRNVHYAFWW